MDGFFMEHPIFFDDLGVPLFLETSMGFHVKFYQKLLLFWGGQIFTPFRAGFWGRASIYLLRKHPGRMPHPTYTHENQEVKQLIAL